MTQSGSDRLIGIIHTVLTSEARASTSPENAQHAVSAANYRGRFAASISILVGGPQLREDFVEVNRFWLPGHVRSVTSSFLLGPTELDIVFSHYQVDTESASVLPR